MTVLAAYAARAQAAATRLNSAVFADDIAWQEAADEYREAATQFAAVIERETKLTRQQIRELLP